MAEHLLNLFRLCGKVENKNKIIFSIRLLLHQIENTGNAPHFKGMLRAVWLCRLDKTHLGKSTGQSSQRIIQRD
jgi:hypothetical protein